MLSVLAVDDEPPALEELLFLLRGDPRVERAEGVGDATEALRRIGRALEPDADPATRLDVLFLDISLPGLSGLDLARLLAGFSKPPAVVFVTAHEGFAVHAFDLKAVDYVLKPVRRDRLAEAVRRVTELIESAAPAGAPEPDPWQRPAGSAAASGPGAQAADPVITVELGGVTRFITLGQVRFAEAQGDYARLHTAEGSHLVRIPLSALEERWGPHGFVRIHRRYLVALHCIDELQTNAGALMVRVSGQLLPVSRRNARELRELVVRRAHDSGHLD
ncbi:response regulator transcription factor [Streptacidiphilus sp. PB12-B1b]|uniref:LytR/AlgR family response regulator transcription factor n=1 Tax=Streptacidiphilus sp. PB12-B1b TaxID=2705012 RepID=UPI0015FB8C8C|nr:LytTR family DNA-binding domain-containing protein [Streptacidiphilus sp. PB12-B1b]QMU77948.1 response regulator transcription factor [Streptacidiphilus sp. PB12-B1b]